MDLQGKKALITGGAVRIGASICEKLVSEGAHVLIHYNSSSVEAEALQERLQKVSPHVFILKADLSRGVDAGEVIDKAILRAGGLDILINNAAVFNKTPFDAITQDVMDGQMGPNLFAPILLTRAFADACDRGKVVNLLDRRVSSLDTSCIPYMLSKRALADFTRMAAVELGPGITVNGVAPGAVLPPPGEGEDYLKEHAGEAVLTHRCTPSDIADAVAFLLKQDAITGQIMYVDSGQHLLGSGKLE